MTGSIDKKPSQSAVLLAGVLLTIAAMAAHRFLPERRLSLSSAAPPEQILLMQSGDGAPAQLDWVDKTQLHYRCHFPDNPVQQGCAFAYLLYPGQNVTEGVDLSGYRKLNLSVRYSGKAKYVRVAIRDFDPRFSKIEDANSPKFNFVNLPVEDVAQPVDISMGEFSVPEWWVGQYDIPRAWSHTDLRNATVVSIDLLGDLGGTQHELQIDRIEFVGDWISAEYWYFGILCLWLVIGTVYGVTQWVGLHRRHRAQRRKIRELESEKVKYQKLSTIDGLTKVLNRHGIEQFIEGLRGSSLPTSVIVIDLDHFKRINDSRGHYVGDRVLQTVGEILSSHTRNVDGLGRWGGEEFVLVCPGASLSNAADLAEKLRHRILQTNFIPEDPLAVTASFGVATTGADESFEDAFRQADQALYLAKSRGRNCVVAAGGDQMHTVTGARKGTWALISGRFRLHK